MSTRGIKPPARLEPRNEFERMVSDGRPSTANVITYEELKTISIFKDVKYERIDLRALPGTIVLRRFVKDEDICLQDNPGYTAFYLLTGKEITELKLAPLKEAAGQSDRVVSVTRAVSVGSGRKKETVRDTAYMGEGELFGEMSCLYRVPRSATVRATRDCYVLEFLRNVLDKINAGPFRNQLDEMYRKRFLELHLRNLELFRNLSDAAYAELRDKVELRALTPGEMLFDEHDSPDGLYIIRSGFVKIIKNISALLGKDSMADWSAFYAALIEGGKETGARHELWKWVSQALPELGKKLALSDSGERDVTEEEQRELLYSLNDLLKKKDFATRIGFAFAGSTAEWADEAKQLAATKKEDPVKIRRFNRQLLESLYPKLIQAYGVDPPRVLAYRSSPEWVSASAAVTVASNADSSFIGEIGMLDNTPRSATCVAYAQSNDRYGGVHVVYVDKQLYQKLVSTVNQATEGKSEARVKQVATERKAETSARMSLPVWQQESTRQQFEELGLIQGQKLMLIDLDRCTRCDKCVEACVESHSPGWFDWLPFLSNTGPRDGRSRLFLEGPRIQLWEDSQIKNYLVPSTCRQCKDPVCLIGCPVGSIHKGDNGQIVIEDWCIGCSRCALNCPYNAIQMHTIGVIPRSTTGWRHWQGKSPVVLGATPFRDSRDFRGWYNEAEPIEFAYAFDLSATQTSKSKTFLLHIVSTATDVTLDINGKPIELRRLDDKEARQKKWNWEAMLSHADEKAPAMLPGEVAPQAALRFGKNEIAIRLSLAKSIPGDMLLDLGLTGYVPPVVDKSVAGDEYKQDWVMELAVVCDMCSGQFGQRPACVTACPHEAADRRFVTYDAFLSGVKK